MKQYAGIANPHFFIGVVENNIDNRHEGRVQVRCFGIHGTLDDIPSEDLPWAIVLTSGGFEFNVIPLNSWVLGMFMDGRDAQQPLVLGVIPQQYVAPINPALNGWGVVPGKEHSRLAQGTRPEDFGQPNVPRLARGENLEETYILNQETNRVRGAAIGGGGSPNLTSSDNAGVASRDDDSNSPMIANPIAESRNIDERATYIRQGLISRGMAPHIADGFIMNMKDESGINSDALNPNDKGKPSFGLCQWRAERKDALFSLAAQNGESSPSVDTQMDYLMIELRSNESSAWARIKNATSAGEAGALVVQHFERPDAYHAATRANKYLSGNGFSIGGIDTSAGAPVMQGSIGSTLTATSFSEPTTAYNAQYPYNRVIETSSGHSFELDDTPGAERVMLNHRSGAYIQMAPTTTTYKSTQDTYDINDRNWHMYVGGIAAITIDGDCHVIVKGNKVEEIMGDHKLIVHGNHETTSAGTLNMNGGEDAQIRAARVSMQSNVENTNMSVGKVLRFESTETMHFKTKNMFFQSDESMHFTVGKDFMMKSTGKLSLASDTGLYLSGANTADLKSPIVRIGGGSEVSVNASIVKMDDIVRMAEGAAANPQPSNLTPTASEPATTVTAQPPATKAISNSGPR